MKKSLKYIGALVAILCGSFFGMRAQEPQPNRILVINQNGNYSGLALESLEQIALREVDGEVSVDVEVLAVEGTESVTVKLTKSFLCESFEFTIVPHIVVQNYNDLALKGLVQSQGSGTRYTEDFQEGVITGINLKPGTSYDILVLAFDSYNTPAGITVANFETAPAVIEGNPIVEHQMISQTQSEFVIRFIPNEDVGGYYVMGFEEGSIEEYLNTWGPWMGATTISELIEIWSQGQALTEEHTYTFNRQNDFYPGELYDIVIAIKDINGNFTEPEIFTASTLAKGGDGEASVEIKLGDYKAELWGGTLKPSQYISYIPNSETFRYRTTVQYAEDYDMYTPEEWVEDLCQDPPMAGMDNWFWQDEITTDYQLDPNTEFVVLAAAQNANREWGPVTVIRHTTPSECPGMPETTSEGKRAPKVEQREIAPSTTVLKGAVMPALREKSELILNNK